MNPYDAASSLYEALLAEAEQWAGDDTEDQQALDAIDQAPTPHDKVELLRNSSLVPSHLTSAIADALLALDPATYSPSPTPTTPQTPMTGPELHRVRDAQITVVNASPEDNTPSDVYEFQVHGVSVLIRRRAQWDTAANVPYVHIEDQNDEPGLLLVEVNNSGEREHPRPGPHGGTA
ncbi:hypothetical protein [Streptomyces clavuligerus]|uniref:hypothetical protein n=1 Tax=Streptomyces clavuligerus TaxID=1901 RepID=UPI00020D920C|nr:hypothetical protein [Streptomyces clavuligerus]WDN56255.1 hypothetical protein LL058_28870 [Streptomyces clavuligerus]